MHTNPVDHAKKIETILESLQGHCRSESLLFTDPKAKALYETAADVLDGLQKAFHDFSLKKDEIWKDGPVSKNDSSSTPQMSTDPWD